MPTTKSVETILKEHPDAGRDHLIPILQEVQEAEGIPVPGVHHQDRQGTWICPPARSTAWRPSTTSSASSPRGSTT